MELYARMFILHLLCVARASEVPPEEIAEFKAAPLTYIEDLSKTPVHDSDGIDGQSTENPRDRRALGLLLSGLAQIFGYTVTPIQYASLPNPNVTRPAAMSNSSKPVNQQAASSRPANITMPRQQETIRFTGVLNLGNNSDIIGHLQQYEQIFHGLQNTTTMMTTTQPASMPPAKISVDPGTNSPTKPPLLAPFFVKIPLPIAPELLPATIPLEDLGLSYPSPAVSIMSGSNENTETPVRKEQEMVYRSNEDTERYTVEEKEIYDEKDVKKPDKYKHQCVDEPSWNKQQNDRRNELQHKQKERVEKLKQQEEERNRDKVAHYNEEEMNKRYRNHEKEIADRNRDYASKHESAEERRPAHDDEEDEDSAERYREYASQENLSNESSKQPQKKGEKEKIEDYPNYDDSNEQSNGYKQSEDLDKYVEVGYNQQLPIGDYHHEGNPEVIRDSYGEVLDNKKLEDDRISGYISMFKHPYVQANAYNSERARNPEDASREENEKESSAEDGYDEHLVRLQKLREEYALPENKYEEYDLDDESEADRNDRESERIQNRTSVGSRRPKIERLRDKEDDRTRRPTESNRNEAARLENAKSQGEVDFGRYMPLVVPVRYIDANDKVQQATTRQLNYKEIDKPTDSRFSEDNVDTARTTLKEKLTPQIGLPERPRQLHEGEYKELQVWPPPFDYAFDNTEPAKSIVPPNPRNYYLRNYAPNHYQTVVREIAAQDANDKASEQPSGYLVVVGNPAYPYRYPHNIYYFSNEAVNSRDQVPHLNAEVTRPRDQVYVPQQSASQQIIQTKPNITEYKLNQTTNNPRDYYYQPQEVPANVLDRYRYIFEERTPQAKEPLNIDVISQIPSTRLKAEVPRNQVYVAQQSANQQIIQTKPNITEFNLNETTNSPRDYYYQPQEVPANVLDRYRYVFEERTPQVKEPYNIDVTSQISNAENWSNRIYRPQSPNNVAERSPQQVFAQLQNIVSSNQNVQNGLPRHSRLLRKRKSLRPEDQRKNDEQAKTPQPILKNKPFDDPQSAHDFFGFSKDDYNFGSESSDATKAAEENDKTTEESDVFVAPEPTVYHYDDESIAKHIDEPENDTEKAKVREYRNKVATLRVSERRQLKPNGPIHYVDFIRNI